MTATIAVAAGEALQVVVGGVGELPPGRAPVSRTCPDSAEMADGVGGGVPPNGVVNGGKGGAGDPGEGGGGGDGGGATGNANGFGPTVAVLTPATSAGPGRVVLTFTPA